MEKLAISVSEFDSTYTKIHKKILIVISDPKYHTDRFSMRNRDIIRRLFKAVAAAKLRGYEIEITFSPERP